jgi:hypothetical protein
MGRKDSCDTEPIMNWNNEEIPVQTAFRIGWNLPMNVLGAGVYGGVVKRDEAGKIIIGDEWPGDNQAPPAHNEMHSKGPYLDFSRFREQTQGYTVIANVLQRGSMKELVELMQSAGSVRERAKLANLVMTGGARPLHLCGTMVRGGDMTALISVLIKYGADVNAKDNYEKTPIDRFVCNSVAGGHVLRNHGAVRGCQLPRGVPQWDSDEFAYTGRGEV